MKLVMTLMVRDEADIIGAWLDHHLAHGVSHFVVTDNSSIDGTTEILEDFASRGVVDLRHDPVHQKQQGTIVTAMARDAHTMHGADWVINADADEFWMPRVAGRTLGDVFDAMPTAFRSFTVEVTDMIGPPALDGTGLQRLRYRDLRPTEEMIRLGLLGHATSDAVHVGSPDVVVSQGNHLVSIASQGAPTGDLEIDVLHFPWRSWAQFSRKVENSGLAYESNPDLQPSPNHHGMRDYRRLRDGTLLTYYVLRHPTSDELERGLKSGHFVLDERVSAERPSPVADVLIGDAVERSAKASGQELQSLTLTLAELAREGERARDTIAGQGIRIRALESERDTLVVRLAAAERLLTERFTDRVLRMLRSKTTRARTALRKRSRSKA